MFIRSLTFATVLAVAGPLWAADSDGPLAQDRGQSRPLIVITQSSLDPTLVKLKKAMEDPANRDGFTQRNVVLYTVVNLMGQRNGKDLDAQSTMALIRELKLGASSAEARVILVGKDGEKKMEHAGPIEPKDIFATIDQLPPQEKELTPPPPPPAPEAKPAKGGKAAKPGKPAAPAEPPKDLDD
jgi:Domain of unknown function (DUF4174)